MEPTIFENKELGLRLHGWNANKKNERAFVASEIMKQLGYAGGSSTLKLCELEDGVDMIKVTKKQSERFIKQLTTSSVVGQRTGSVIMLYESGIWKLIMKSKTKLGVKTRNWLAREVLPSIAKIGSYSIDNNKSSAFESLFGFTERNEQIKNSKTVNAKLHAEGKDFSKYHNEVHKLVNGMTAKEIKTMFNSKESAREIIRKEIPENACALAAIDEMYFKYNLSISKIESIQAHKTLPPAFKTLLDAGFNIQIGE